jgi:hypothetical protein
VNTGARTRHTWRATGAQFAAHRRFFFDKSSAGTGLPVARVSGMVHFPVHESCAALLLKVLAQTDGDAVVLHGGDTPYLVGASGEKALARKALSTDAVERLAQELLPFQSWEALGKAGTVEHHCLATAAPGVHFMIVAEMDDDLWIEVRRVRGGDGDVVALPSPQEFWQRN